MQINTVIKTVIAITVVTLFLNLKSNIKKIHKKQCKPCKHMRIKFLNYEYK